MALDGGPTGSRSAPMRYFPRQWLFPAGFAAALAVGAMFRLAWLSDVEFKGDEAWTLQQVQEFWHTHALTAVGIPSSAGLPNAGLSLWAFLAISAFLPVIGPLELTRAVQLINIVALVFLAVFVRVSVPRADREPWLWAVALVSVNPLAVLFSRKLWIQDIIPLFTLVMLVGWWHRGRRWGAFVWGLAGALIGQVHLSGIVFAGAFLAAVLLFDRRSVRWPAWAIGSVLGVLPGLPWLLAIAQQRGAVHAATLHNPLIPFGHWTNFALGIDLYKSLGDDFVAFLAFPPIGGHASFAAAALIVVIVGIFWVLLAHALSRLRTDRAQTAAFLFSPRCSTSLALDAGFFGYCALLAAMPQPVYLPYIVVAFVLPALWLCWIARAGAGACLRSLRQTRRLLAVLVLAQAGLTALFLTYVHQVQVIHGDYGTAFGAQRAPP